MTASTFMQFGTESDIDAKDVGQPKFRLIEPQRAGDDLYVLLGSLHMPLETDDAIAEVEEYINSPMLHSLLIAAMQKHFERTIDPYASFEYVPQYREAYYQTTGLERTAS